MPESVALDTVSLEPVIKLKRLEEPALPTKAFEEKLREYCPFYPDEV